MLNGNFLEIDTLRFFFFTSKGCKFTSKTLHGRRFWKMCFTSLCLSGYCTKCVLPSVLNDLWKTRLSCGRMIGLLANPLPLPPVSKLSLFLRLPVSHRSSLLTGEGGGGGWGDKYDREKAWPSINHSILFAILCMKSLFRAAILNNLWGLGTE